MLEYTVKAASTPALDRLGNETYPCYVNNKNGRAVALFPTMRMAEAFAAVMVGIQDSRIPAHRLWMLLDELRNASQAKE